jgi:putative endonuclease
MKNENSASEMSQHLKTGILGERVAADYLQSKGYTIVSRNYRFLKYEIDIIAKKDQYIVFVEVKTRTEFNGTKYGRPSRAIDLEKRKNLVKAAKSFMKYLDIKGLFPRFDAVEVYVNSDPITAEKTFKVNHMIGVFGAGGRLI